MKIGITLNGSIKFPSGGVKVIYQYANFIAANKEHQVTIYYNMNCGRLKNLQNLKMFQSSIARYLVHIRPNWFKLHPDIRKKAIFNIDDDAIDDGDVIVATAVKTAPSVAALADSKGKKFYFIQDFENWDCVDDFVFQTYKLNMENITVAKWLSEIVDAISKHPSVCISNGIDTDIFRTKISTNNRLRHSIAMQYNSSKHKGCFYAFETIRILEKKYSDLKVIVFGAEHKPDDLPSCCEYVMRASQEKVAKINNSVQIFMCSSINEGFGLPGLEAMACGCVLVSTMYKGVFEYAENGKNALLSPVKDAQAMALNIVSLFSNNELRLQLAENAMRTGQKRSVKESAEKFANVLLQNKA